MTSPNKIAAALLAGVVTSLTGAAAQAADCKIGISMSTLNAPYYAAQEAAVRDEGKKLGCDVLSSDGQRDMNKQISDIEDMVARKVSLLLVNPQDPEGLVPAVNAASAAGIKVVVIDADLNPKANFVTHVQSSNVENGELVGRWLAKTLGGKPATVAIISGNQGNPGGENRRMGVVRGYVEGQLAGSGVAKLNIVAQGWGGWTSEGGVSAMEDIITAHPDVNVVIGENDSMVLGARRALEAAHKLDGVLLLAAADGQKEALALIKEGKYGATGLNDPDLIGRTGVEIGMKSVKGELPAEFPKHYLIKPEVISKENVDRYYRPDSVF
ncbi:substrate-binding domain-containing protein [Labrys wisconsinensis]|uniref:Ribose transport system substrate-binding protein n=1 Tax=Labrys wisconsinensis TaxID=425677 RepID=A0ABU0JLR0_9HYPH|nr:substrate-binding domain-containing protein [Labrys wisconsinensis]MDQ0474179.1 ribose transport system substrate-binding protein [Labrys wisconsinensis]